MSSSTLKKPQVSSDAVSEVTLFDNTSTHSRADTVVEAGRDLKASFRQSMRNLRGPRTANGGSMADPNKNWEARYLATR